MLGLNGTELAVSMGIWKTSASTLVLLLTKDKQMQTFSNAHIWQANIGSSQVILRITHHFQSLYICLKNETPFTSTVSRVFVPVLAFSYCRTTNLLPLTAFNVWMLVGWVVVSIGKISEHDNILNNRENTITRELFSHDVGLKSETKQYSNPKKDKNQTIL